MLIIILIGSAGLAIISGKDYENEKEDILESMEECYNKTPEQCILSSLFERSEADNETLDSIRVEIENSGTDISEEDAEKAIDILEFLKERNPEERKSFIEETVNQ